MRFPLKLLCQALGLSSIVLVMNYGDLLGGGGDARMHVPYPLTGVIIAHITDIFLLGLVFFALLIASRRARLQPYATLFIAIVLPPYILKRAGPLCPVVMHDHLVAPISIVWLVLVIFVFYKFPTAYQFMLQAGDAIGICFAVFAFASIAQLLWIVRWKPGQQQQQAQWALSAQPARQHPLLVWIVFDELSYDQTFEHRASGLALPAFDALRNQSTLFTNVQPAGIKTAEVVPSLLGGTEINNIRFTLTNHLWAHDKKPSAWKRFDGDSTMFHTAQQAGWRTAAVGWYNPYCTMYSGAIDSCYWNNLDQTDGPMSLQKPYWTNVFLPLRQLAEEIVTPHKADFDACSYEVKQRYRTEIDLNSRALQVLKQDQADFVFIHLPIPHSPNIWNRFTNSYRNECGGSYVDNLALTDQVLGKFMQVLQSSPRWNDTTVIVEGDHSWRVHLWDWKAAWTDEDRAASHEIFDTRPALLVHQANQQQAVTNASAWPLVRIHSVIENVLQSRPASF